jgi:phosphinothricin acetyltransferase
MTIESAKTNKNLNFEKISNSIERQFIRLFLFYHPQTQRSSVEWLQLADAATGAGMYASISSRQHRRYALSCETSEEGNPDTMDIRAATISDVPDIQSIYAYHVLHGTGTFEEDPPSVEEMQARFRKVVDRGFVWLVACDDTGVLGFGYYAPFRERSAYRFTVEDSIYVRQDVRGQGVGKQLVIKLIELATAAGLRQMIAVIGDSENVGSIGVHSSLGFHMIGTMKSAGIKFGRWLDVVTMQRPLGRGDATLPD